jgi:hypothetical protein
MNENPQKYFPTFPSHPQSERMKLQNEMKFSKKLRSKGEKNSQLEASQMSSSISTQQNNFTDSGMKSI